jgi:hypothetical protein
MKFIWMVSFMYPDKNLLRIYVSHSDTDEKIVSRLIAKLQTNLVEETFQVQFWRGADILYGELIVLEKQNHLNLAHIVFIFISEKSIHESGLIQKEWRWIKDALDGKPENNELYIIPILVNGCNTVPTYLSGYKFVHYNSKVTKSLITELLKSIYKKANAIGIVTHDAKKISKLSIHKYWHNLSKKKGEML